MCIGDWLGLRVSMPMLALTDAHRAQYVCMDSSCAESAIDAWTLLAIITSSRRGGKPRGWVCMCVYCLVCVSLCFPAGFLSPGLLRCQRAWNSSSAVLDQCCCRGQDERRDRSEEQNWGRQFCFPEWYVLKAFTAYQTLKKNHWMTRIS